jgi:hypothetical protein
MSRAVVVVALATMECLLGPPSARGQSHDVLSGLEGSGPLRTGSPILKASLERIAARSALWREALDAVRESDRHALILTPDQVVVADAQGGATRSFDPTVLAEVAPVPTRTSQVRVVLVVINLPLLEHIHSRRRSLPVDLEADLDRILVHEIYGHAIPYLVAGDLSGRCADPVPSQRAEDACAIRRENAIRAELRLGRRTDSGLGGLSLARGGLR